MQEIISEVFRKWGVLTVVASVTAAATVWAFAHLAAEPGKRVSVLWGIAQYTKQPQVAKPASRIQQPSDTQKSTSAEASLAAERLRADQAEREFTALRRKVDQLNQCPQALLLGRLVGIAYEPGYSGVAERLARTLRSAGATGNVNALSANEMGDGARFGTVYYRDEDVAEKAHAVRQLIRPKYETEVKAGNWAFSPADFTIWIGAKRAG